jgi:NTE family protein
VAGIGDFRFAGGGVCSPSNADLAVGYERAVIIAPLGRTPPLDDWRSREQKLLRRRGSSVTLIDMEAEAQAAIGPDRLDPAMCMAAAAAGWLSLETEHD